MTAPETDLRDLRSRVEAVIAARAKRQTPSAPVSFVVEIVGLDDVFEVQIPPDAGARPREECRLTISAAAWQQWLADPVRLLTAMVFDGRIRSSGAQGRAVEFAELIDEARRK